MSSRRLWLTVLIGPLAWVAYVHTAYAFAPWACKRPTGGVIVMLAAAVFALALSSAGLAAAWQGWRRVDHAGDGGTATARSRVIALAGIGTSALIVLVVVAGMLPLLLLAPCR